MPAIAYGVGSWPRTVAVGDFNGDGIQDLVSANGGYFNVSILLGNGDGTFQLPAATYDTGVFPHSVIVGDFNGDGIQDLATADNGSSQVSVLLGKGDGSFHAASSYSVGSGSSPRSVNIGDFNGDGVQDLVTADSSSNRVSVLLGNGDGTFSAAVGYGTASQPHSVAVGDFNGDGIPDLVTANPPSDQISVLLGNGDGSFLAPVSYSISSGPVSVKVGDFNGDGVSDLVTADSNSNQLSVLLGNSSQQTTSAGDLLTDISLDQFSLRTRHEALQSLTEIDKTEQKIYTMRGIIGAFHARLETAIEVTSMRSENLAAAESQIRDVDVGDEASQLVRNQILQQAGAAVLGQANQSPSLALTLLEGL